MTWGAAEPESLRPGSQHWNDMELGTIVGVQGVASECLYPHQSPELLNGRNLEHQKMTFFRALIIPTPSPRKPTRCKSAGPLINIFCYLDSQGKKREDLPSPDSSH